MEFHSFCIVRGSGVHFINCNSEVDVVGPDRDVALPSEMLTLVYAVSDKYGDSI